MTVVLLPIRCLTGLTYLKPRTPACIPGMGACHHHETWLWPTFWASRAGVWQSRCKAAWCGECVHYVIQRCRLCTVRRHRQLLSEGFAKWVLLWHMLSSHSGH